MSVEATSATATAGVDPSRAKIAGAIKRAADTVGTSFEYMLATAKMESNFNPKAGASTSSARGLYQFIDQTWLGTVKEAGSQLGYGKYADAITRSPSGSYSVRDPAARNAIMKLRDDPTAASSMAAVLAQSNSFKLTGKLGRRPTDGELYMAHFMGAGGAAKLIANAEDHPNATGARLFPNAAAANRPIFFDRSGRARSVSEVYAVLNSRYASAANSQATRTAMAAVGAASATTNTSPPTDPIFRSLFQAGERTEPVSPRVRELWGNSSSLTSVAPATSVAGATPVAPASSGLPLPAQTPEVRAPQRLDLFSDRAGIFS